MGKPNVRKYSSAEMQQDADALADAVLEIGGVVCQSYPDFWFPEGKAGSAGDWDDLRHAKKLCGECPLQQMCLDYALKHHEEYGIWGGTTPGERKKVWEKW